MKTISGKKMCSILEKKGWTLARITGSHRIYTREDSVEKIPVPVHANKDLKTGLQKHFMKLAGLSEEDIQACN